MSKENWYEGLGLMSGSSLDGLDIAWCRFRIDPESAEKVLDWEMGPAETLPIPEEWKQRLRQLPDGTARDLALAHAALGRFWGDLCLEFMERHACRPQFIASHGHTIFHWPEAGVSTQIGDGACIAARTGVPVICDFRMGDVALGGQGAPVAPLADHYLFPGYDYYLNIGGIANVSFQRDGRWVAFDTGPANQMLDALAREAGLAYDAGGELAAQGQIEETILERINALPYFSQPPPKSLDNGWIQKEVLPFFRDQTLPLSHRLCTAVEQLARQTARAMREWGSQRTGRIRVFVSGGGAYNTFLMSRLEANLAPWGSVQMVVPGAQVVEFKEALLMALMGAFRLAGIPNCLAEVTGASKDSVGGAVYL
ncbi:MAG: anhydro-N-acetylmuramic acid kinase [Saprospirales bacterium]|nr:anhydro-N-acetylmuramic acid kinase [Saprospirales bacterium]MBK8490668.1 anhydro-N-acetylmuramic acid kinase [Saprospirales bacterium]